MVSDAMSDNRRESLTAQLAGACTGMARATLPERVRERTKLILLDTLGAMLSASRPTFPGTRRLETYLDVEQCAGPCVVVGTTRRASPADAALVNGYLAYALDIESHHGPAVVHAAAAVVPAVLAAATVHRSSGQALLTAAAFGIDVACRVSLAIGPNDLYQRGFHPNSIAGTFGAAAAAGALAGLDAQQFARAFGLAATATSGLLAWASDETEESRPLNPGLAAHHGLLAAHHGLLAAHLAVLGFGAPRAIFDRTAKYNVFRAWSLDGVGSPDRLLHGFGETVAVEELIIKRHACCAFLHPAIDGLLEILEHEGLTADDVAGITIAFPRSGAPVIDNNPLRSHRAQYILPLAALHRRIDFADIIGDRSAEPGFQRLAAATAFVCEDELDQWYPERYATKLTVTTRGGADHVRRVDWARGTPQNPMATAEIIAKFRRLAAERVSPDRAERTLDRVMDLDRLDDLSELDILLSVSSAHVL